ncbi:hypothetical protein Pint_04631 [Pistacia integerrima]
MNLHR